MATVFAAASFLFHQATGLTWAEPQDYDNHALSLWKDVGIWILERLGPMGRIGLTALSLVPVGGLAAGWLDYGSSLQGNGAVLPFDAVAMGRVTPLDRCVGRANHNATRPELGPGRR